MRKVDVICVRGAALMALAVGLTACSGDTQRFNENPYASRSPAQDVTGSVPATKSAPVARVDSHPLQSSQLPPPATKPAVVAAHQGVAGGGAGIYQPAGGHDVTGSVKTHAAPVALQPPQQPQAQWTWVGGSTVTV